MADAVEARNSDGALAVLAECEAQLERTAEFCELCSAAMGMTDPNEMIRLREHLRGLLRGLRAG